MNDESYFLTTLREFQCALANYVYHFPPVYQVRSVTSGQGLALRAGPVGLGSEAGVALHRDWARLSQRCVRLGPEQRRGLPVECLSCAADLLFAGGPTVSAGD